MGSLKEGGNEKFGVAFVGEMLEHIFELLSLEAGLGFYVLYPDCLIPKIFARFFSCDSLFKRTLLFVYWGKIHA